MPAKQLMTAAEIVKDRERWLKMRREGIGASDVAAMLGICNGDYGSPFELFVEKTTGQQMRGDADAMARGRYLEPYVVERFSELRPELAIFDGGLYCAEGRPWQMATFDRLTLDLAAAGMVNGGPVRRMNLAQNHSVVYPAQIKTSVPSPRHVQEHPEDWGPPGTDQIPDAYRAQVLAEMDVWNASLVLIPVLFIQSWKLGIYAIRRDEDAEHDIEVLRQETERFMNRIADNDPPPIDWTPATTRALRTMYPAKGTGSQVIITRTLADQYRSAYRARARANEKLNLAVNKILAASDGNLEVLAPVHGRGTEPVQVAVRRSYPRKVVDVEKLRRKYPIVAREVERKTDVDALWAGKWAKE